MYKIIMLLTIITFTCNPAAVCKEKTEVYFRENFDSLKAWKLFDFPNITLHTKYTVEIENRQNVLKIAAQASASGLIHNKVIDIRKYPVLRWRWKVKNILKKGNVNTRKGDDCPIRICLLFEHDNARAGLLSTLKHSLTKSLGSRQLPQSSLNYIWASKPNSKRIIPSAYTDQVKIIILHSGENRLNTWIEEERNILDDYKSAFGQDPPAKVVIAIMGDTDNTGEATTAWIDYIESGK
jgi:hypothetical protein